MTPHAFDASGFCARCGTRVRPSQTAALMRGVYSDCDRLRADVCDRHRLEPDEERDGCPECAEAIQRADLAASVIES